MFSSQNSQVSSDANYIEDVFSTWLVTGDGTAPAVNNGIDVSGEGGLVWTKKRSAAGSHSLFDTARGANLRLISNDTAAQDSVNLSFTSTGFSNYTFDSGVTYATWTFRNQPKFFQCLTYTGNGTNGRTVAHSLGSVPACMIIKRTDSANGWAVYHRSMNTSPQDYMMRLNATDGAFTTSPSRWNNTLPTATEFTLSGNDEVNGSGATYVAYLFAHNAGGFGLTGTDNVISCGSFDANNGEVIDLGYEPQWLLYKPSGDVGNWRMVDNMRGFTNLSGTNAYTTQQLLPNSSNAEASNSGPVLTSTGFTWNQSGGGIKHIYIAIRRGPMKVPLDANKVFGAETWTGNAASPRTFTSSNWTFPADLVTVKGTNNSAWWNQWSPRLTGGTLSTNDTGAEQTSSTSIAGYVSSFNQTGYTATSGSSSISNYNANSDTYVSYNLRRAPSFMDVVCYTGTGSVRTINHNLGVAPELMIVKCRSGNLDWTTYQAPLGANQVMRLNSTIAAFTDASVWNGTAPTSSVFSVGTSIRSNSGGDTFVIYLFATCPGVSKVGSYTGTGALQTINCGFTSGARFVMIKRTDSTGDWFYYDSVRGITSGNDPYLLFNSSNQQVTNTNFVDTDSTGFKVTASAPAEMNASGGTYIFLAIA